MSEYTEDPAHPNRRTDEFGRWYRSPAGVWCSGITTITGWHEKPSIDKWKSWVGEAEAERVSKASGQRGKEMHAAIERFCNGERSEDNSEGSALARNLFPLLRENLRDIVLSETPLYADSMRVMGRLDMFATWKGKKSIIDFKSANRPKKASHIRTHFLQTCFYRYAAKESKGLEAEKLIVLVSHGKATQEFACDWSEHEARTVNLIVEFQNKLPKDHFSLEEQPA